MVKRVTGLNTLSYLGVEAPTPPNYVEFDGRNPTTTDSNFNRGTVALRIDNNTVFMLTSLSAGSATWTQIGGTGTGADTFNADAGSATPSGGAITMAGGSNLNTSGASSTVTFNLDSSPSVSGTFTANGDITSTTGDIVASAGDLISTLGAVDAATTVTAGTTLIAGMGITVSAFGAGVVQTNGSGVFSSDNGTNGQVLIGGGSAPAWANITSTGGTVTVTNGANTINLETTSSGVIWNEETGTSANMAVNQGYIANNAGLVTFTMPATASFGERVRVGGKGAGGWAIAQNAGQTIHFGSTDTTTGVGGSLASTNRYDAIELLCITDNTDWVVLSSLGNITIV